MFLLMVFASHFCQQHGVQRRSVDYFGHHQQQQSTNRKEMRDTHKNNRITVPLNELKNVRKDATNDVSLEVELGFFLAGFVEVDGNHTINTNKTREISLALFLCLTHSVCAVYVCIIIRVLQAIQQREVKKRVWINFSSETQNKNHTISILFRDSIIIYTFLVTYLGIVCYFLPLVSALCSSVNRNTVMWHRS